jgi:hypothetical protein
VRELELAQRNARDTNARALWLRFDYGPGSMSRPSDTDLTFGLGAVAGMPVAERFDAVYSALLTGITAFTDDPNLGEELLLLTVGPRWFPIGRTRLSRSGHITHAWLYTQAELGYAQLDRGPDHSELSTVGRGIALGARLGVVTTAARDWTIGIELRDHLALLNGDESMRHAFGVHLFVQLYLRPVRRTLSW